jgi:hypothetical protein
MVTFRLSNRMDLLSVRVFSVDWVPGVLPVVRFGPTIFEGPPEGFFGLSKRIYFPFRWPGSKTCSRKSIR